MPDFKRGLRKSKTYNDKFFGSDFGLQKKKEKITTKRKRRTYEVVKIEVEILNH